MGHDVEWETELVDLTPGSQAVTATLRNPRGDTESVTADWLIGADGVQSRVRRALGIPFNGRTYPHEFFVLDCKVSWSLPADEMYAAFSRESFGAFFPMPGGRCRVMSILPPELEGRDEIGFEDVRTELPRRLCVDITLSDPGWISLYRAHHRYAASFQVGRCFLAGDAAHIHSPVGAQGMNTGLQDAYNLAWKLALVIAGQLRPEVLATYSGERLPVARTLVRTTDRVFAITVSENSLVRLAPMYVAPRVLPLAVKLPPLSSFAFKAVSELGIRYRRSPLSRHASWGRFPYHAPKPGDRLPYVMVEDAGEPTNLQDKVDGTRFCLLVFDGIRRDGRPAALVTDIAEHDSIMSVHHVPFSAMNRSAYRTFGISGDGYYLVRPDSYIACRSADLDGRHLVGYLRRLRAGPPVARSTGSG
jgi:2-polyprenyl-6-methoxyphenol hydroxylase-like FAD-dependent oxidoreductase